MKYIVETDKSVTQAVEDLQARIADEVEEEIIQMMNEAAWMLRSSIE